MNIDPTEIRLTPKLQVAIAHYAQLEGKQWEEVLEDRFPVFEQPTEEELQQTLEMCDRGVADARAGRGTEVSAAISQISERLGLNRKQ